MIYPIVSEDNLFAAQFNVTREPNESSFAGGGTNPSVAQTCVAYTAGPSTAATCTFGVNVTNGNTLAVWWNAVGNQTTNDLSSVTKSSGTATLGSSTLFDHPAYFDNAASGFALVPVTGTGSLTIVANSVTSVNDLEVFAVEVNCNGHTCAVDNGQNFSNTFAGTTGSFPFSTMTPTGSQDIAITYLTQTSFGGQTLTKPTGYTQVDLIQGGYIGAIGYKVLNGSSAESPTWTATGGAINVAGEGVLLK